MNKRNQEMRKLEGQLYNLYSDDVVLERANGAPPLELQVRDRVRLCFAPADGGSQLTSGIGHDFWQVAKLWTRRECALEATRCVMTTEPGTLPGEPRMIGTLNGFRLLSPLLRSEEMAMLQRLREIVRAARPGEIMLKDWPQQPDWATSRFVIATWSTALIAAAQDETRLEQLVIPANPVFDRNQGTEKAIRYQGLVLARDLFACWQQPEEGGGWPSP